MRACPAGGVGAIGGQARKDTDLTTAHTAIATLVHRYAELVDAGDLPGVAALFADATYGAADGPVRRGADEVLAALRDAIILHEGVPCTKHVITNLIVVADETGGAATARSYFTVLQATPALPLQTILAGRYHDRFRRDRDGWAFAERRIHIDLVGDLREHVRLRR
jgi:3-phenylpropionate/cinnamic acid dioxygenase small subunit